MWLEAIVTHEDLQHVLREFLPVTIALDPEDASRTLWLGEAREVSLTEGEGVRVSAPATLTWTVAGIATRISLASLTVRLRPRFRDKLHGQSLAFELALEEADIVGLPALIDHTIMNAVNAALARKDLEWNFTHALSQRVPLAGLFDQVTALSVRVS